MAPADKKKGSKASSRSKVTAVPQQTILDLLTKKKVPSNGSDREQTDEDVNSAQHGLAGNDAADSTITNPSIIPPIASLPEDLIPKAQTNGQKNKAPREKQMSKAKTAEDDIIDITDDGHQQPTAGPSNLEPSRTTRSASKLLIRTEPSLQAPPQPPRSSDGGTRRDPIVLDSSSPAKPQATVDLKKPTHSIFAPRKPPPQAPSPSKPKLSKADNKTLETPFPDATCQHVRGPQSEFKTVPLQFTRRLPKVEVMDVDGLSTPLDLSAFRTSTTDQDNIYSQLLRPTRVQTIQSARNDYIKTIPNEHVRDHPAITHLVRLSSSSSTETELSSSSPGQDLWTDKWRPHRADHVLGDEHHALYLRDWLCALELQLETRPENSQKPQQKSNPKSKSTTALVRGMMDEKLKGKDANVGGIRGVKRQRPRVVRAVQKIKGRKKLRVESDEEDWIVDTDDEDEIEGNEYAGLREESEEDDEDDVEFCRKQTLSRLRRMDSSPTLASSPPPQIKHAPLSSSDLHNTLLLAGPTGSGKTTAVYACAKELDWDVFEVYPGVGKRSGSSLDQLVGEVGKNHLVRKAGSVKKKDVERKKNAFMELLGNGKEKVDVDAARKNGTEGEPIEIDDEEHARGKRSNGDFGFVVPKTTTGTVNPDSNAKEQASEPTQGVRQSLILLEEIDILFEEDRGFWSAVINIIKDCRRPVIMTCNDISLVPTSDLPLQSILFFQPCPPPVAASYLQGLCLADGCLVDRNSLLELCESTRRMHNFDMPDSLLNPLTDGFAVPDLRRAINRLQLCISTTSTTKPEPTEVLRFEKTRDEYLDDLADWNTVLVSPVASGSDAETQLRVLRGLISHTETLSCIDSRLSRRPLDMPEALVFNDYEPSPDDAIGHTHLFNASGRSNALATYFKDEMICEEAIRCSRGILKACHNERSTATSSIEFQTRALFRARVEYQTKMLALLWPGLVPLHSHILPRPAVFLDYVPWVRYMAQVDDVYEQAGDWEANVNPRSGRMTRNSAKGSYERQLTLSDHQRGIIAVTGLDGFGPD